MATTTTEVDNELHTIAAEQRREFMAARVIESDLDLAFHLQLQEALTASLYLQPSSSTSPPPPPPPPLPTGEDSTTVIDIQNLELDKFETQLKDWAITETETKKLRDDLYRGIHDEKLAREIQQLPEDQWLEFGDNFERPFGEGSSKSVNDDEVFRVYFKGLIGEESVRCGSVRTVTLAGVGIAICDSRDELIFVMRKPVVVTERASRGSVEWKALIEALNTAIALDLKRIVFYCDYYTLYQFVIGRWSPKQRKIATLVNQVNLLRKKFTYSRPSLIARNDVKFAFKLAREAIDSQMSKAVVSSTTKLETCVICLEDTDAGEFFSVDDCKHRYCFSCMKQHVEVKLLHGMVPKCPHEGCNLELKIGSCEKFLMPKLIEMMRQRLKEASIPVTEKVYCPYPKCSALMSKMEVLENSRVAFVGAERSGARICIKCNGPFCINCKVPWHRNMTCADYKRRNPVPLVEDAKLKNLAARNLWRQCVKCNHMIELAAGCFHMTCRCGYEFCYTCGAEWKDKKATCTCPLWDEEHIMYDNDEEDGELFEDDEDDDYYDSNSDSDFGFYY